MSCCCTAAWDNREALRKAGRAKETVLHTQGRLTISVLGELHIFALGM